jgi:hypothetical protein
VRRLGILLLLIAAAGPAVAARAAAVAPLGQVLPAAYARAARLWPQVDGGFGGRRIAASLERRTVRSLRLPRAAVPRVDTLAEGRSDEFDPRKAVYSSFRAGPDTLRFTYGHMAEAFGGVPRLILGTVGAPRRVVPLSPLAHWNVEAVWYTGDYLIFGCTFEPEGAVAFEQIALWHLPSGRWYTSPREERLLHRGFRLRLALGDWRTATASSDSGSVVIAGAGSALVLTPGDGTWSLTDGTGRAIAPAEHKVARRLVPVTAVIHSHLRASLLAAFREWNPGVDSVRLLEVLRDPCVGRPGAAVLAMGIAPPPTLRAAQSPDIQATLNSQLFGVFMADSVVGSITSRVDMFPTSRFGDYVVYFDLEAKDDGIIVYGQGETYGDEEMRRGYSCGN